MLKRIVPFLTAALLIAALPACMPVQMQNSVGDQAVAFSPADSIDPAVGNALNDFSLDLFKQTVSEAGEGNTLISPLSIWLTLCMAYNGASGDTAKEMAAALHASGISLSDLNGANKGLMGVLEAADPKAQADISNSVWLSKAYSGEIEKSFLDLMSGSYGAELQAVDFNGSTADAIDRWVSGKTQGKIRQIVGPPFDSNTVMLLVDAVYFNAPWKRAFDASLTQQGPFALPEGKIAQVWFMLSENGNCGYAGDDVIAARLPYASGRLEMDAIMPVRQALPEFVASLDAQKLNTYINECGYTDMSLSFPKFKADCGTDLKDALTAMGMGDAFDKDKADFGKMVKATKGFLWISGVAHKASIEVNEQGTEASAASRVDMVAATPPPVQQMEFSKPFLYLIRDKSTGAILFIGSMEDPE